MSGIGHHGYGEVWLVDLATGVETLLSQTSTYTLSVTEDTTVRLDSRGGPLYEADAVPVAQSGTVSIQSHEVSTDTIARLFGAQPSQLAATPAVRVYTQRPADSWVTLDLVPRPMLSITPTYAQPATAGVDYEVDLVRGRLHTITGGLGAVSVAYSPVTPHRVVQHDRAPVWCGLRLIGANRGCGPIIDVSVGECVLTPAGPLDLKGQWTSVSLEARVLNRSLVVSSR